MAFCRASARRTPSLAYANDDVILGRGGADTIHGGAGNDALTGNAGADTIDGGANTDTVNYSIETGGGAVTVDLSADTFGSVASSHAIDTYGTTDTLSNVENVTAVNGTYGDTVVLDGALSEWSVAFSVDHWTLTRNTSTCCAGSSASYSRMA